MVAGSSPITASMIARPSRAKIARSARVK